MYDIAVYTGYVDAGCQGEVIDGEAGDGFHDYSLSFCGMIKDTEPLFALL